MSGRVAITKSHRIKACHRRRWKRAAAHREYQHTDALGTPVAITNASRTVTERREYEPYGYQTTPALQDGPNYTGHVADAATGLIYMQARYCDPLMGRCLSVDPVTAYDNGDMRFFNRYAYAFNNPYAFTDPDGRWPERNNFPRTDHLYANAAGYTSPAGTFTSIGHADPRGYQQIQVSSGEWLTPKQFWNSIKSDFKAGGYTTLLIAHCGAGRDDASGTSFAEALSKLVPDGVTVEATPLLVGVPENGQIYVGPSTNNGSPTLQVQRTNLPWSTFQNGQQTSGPSGQKANPPPPPPPPPDPEKNNHGKP